MTRHADLALAAALLSSVAAHAQTAAPAEQTLDRPNAPRWEAGLAAGGGRVADYPGSDQTHTRGIVLPVFIYRGPVLRIDNGSIRGRFVSTPDWEFDLSATAAFNARNNEARQGMRGLDYLFGVGPQWVYKGWQARSGGPSVHLKFRALMSTDLKRIDQRGVSFDPELRWRLSPLAGSPDALTLSLQPTWASRELQRYFYEVPASDATATRPAYVARAGYLGTDVAATWTGRPARSLSWFVTARAMSLHGAANEASPLLRDKTNVSVGAGLVWTPWRSAESVPD
jgi:outer membrane protein